MFIERIRIREPRTEIFYGWKRLVIGLPSYRGSQQPFREDIHYRTERTRTFFFFTGYFHLSRSGLYTQNQLNPDWKRIGNTFYVSTRYTQNKNKIHNNRTCHYCSRVTDYSTVIQKEGKKEYFVIRFTNFSKNTNHT
jgi:hypothetical protein